jgi:CheY-like chemotaxis protein
MQEKIIILHVEDSHLSQELFKRIVQDRDDIKLVQADGVIEAIYLLGSMRRVDFAVLDYKLPVYSIEEVIKILKKRKIPYIILTGYDSEDLAEEFEIEDIYHKPMSKETFNQVLERKVS